MKTCTHQGCTSLLLARGLCRKHYLRWYKHGDPSYVLDRKLIAKKGKDLPQTKHGLWNHPLYPTWHTMMSRCYNVKNKKYSRYGERGITVCERWHDVSNFISDMSPKPYGMSLDRFDNNGPYEPQNCRWATSVQQARNRPQAKLTDSIRLKILIEYEKSRSPKKVSELLGVLPSDVKNVVYGEKNRLKRLS